MFPSQDSTGGCCTWQICSTLHSASPTDGDERDAATQIAGEPVVGENVRLAIERLPQGLAHRSTMAPQQRAVRGRGTSSVRPHPPRRPGPHPPSPAPNAAPSRRRCSLLRRRDPSCPSFKGGRSRRGCRSLRSIGDSTVLEAESRKRCRDPRRPLPGHPRGGGPHRPAGGSPAPRLVTRRKMRLRPAQGDGRYPEEVGQRRPLVAAPSWGDSAACRP